MSNTRDIADSAATINYIDGLTSDAQAQLNAKASLASPTFTGTVTIPAATVTGNIVVSGTVDGRDVATDGTKLDGIESGATADQTAAEILTAINTVDGTGSGLDADLLDGQEGSYYTGYADTAVANLVASAPSTLDTLNELAAALGDDANFSTTITNSIATKAPLASPTFTGTVTIPAATVTGDVSFGDSDKAIFGASNDLEIYHNGTNGFVENNNGLLILRNTSDDRDVAIQSDDSAGGIANYLLADGSTGAINLYHYGNEKLATTATGIDVTGTATMDGLTVDGDGAVNGSFTISGTAEGLRFTETDTTDLNTYITNSGGDLLVRTANDAYNSFTTRVRIDHATGDISFYEDTGTTTKFFWDASAESLGIGTSSPARSIHVAQSVPSLRLEDTDVANLYGEIVQLSTGDLSFRADQANVQASTSISFSTDGTEKVRIDSSGNVGIGTDSPASISGGTSVHGTLTIGSSDGSIVVSDVVGALSFSTSDASYTGTYADGITGEIASVAETATGGAYGLAFYTASASGAPRGERLRIAASGNVGIGTSSPTEKLDVTGTVKATNYTDTVYGLSGTALDPANGGIQTKTLAANTTFTDSLSSGESMVLQLEGGSTYTVTWPTITWVTSSGNVAPTLTAKDAIVLWKVSTVLYGAAVGSYA